MRKRLLKPLVYLLVAAQFLVAAPAMALTGAQPSDSKHCEQAEMVGANDAGQCPCCPDGVDSLKNCLASCTLAAVAAPDARFPARAAVPSLRVDAAPSAPLLSISDPPLKPPPIR